MKLNNLTLGGLLDLGCIFGFLIGGWVSQQIGKKITLIVSNFGSFILWIMLAFSIESVELITFARFLMGFCSAIASVCVGRNALIRLMINITKVSILQGAYISETSHSGLRKILVTLKASGSMLGYLLANILGVVFSDWRYSALAVAVVPLLGSVSMLFFPETPYWLASVGRLNDSRYE